MYPFFYRGVFGLMRGRGLLEGGPEGGRGGTSSHGQVGAYRIRRRFRVWGD